MTPPRIANPAEVARMSWHQRERYNHRIRAWLDAHHTAQHTPDRATILLRAIIAGLDEATREHDDTRYDQSPRYAPCGTTSAYKRHLRHGERCEPCMKAASADRAEQKRNAA